MIDRRAERSVVSPQLYSSGDNLYSFGGRTDIELHVDTRLLLVLDVNAGRGLRLEALHLDGDGVLADLDQRERIVAVHIGDGSASFARLSSNQHHVRSGHYGAATVGNGSQNFC